MRQAFIGVDVGTASARAGIFVERGGLLATLSLFLALGDLVE
jgi:ribulose kinase